MKFRICLLLITPPAALVSDGHIFHFFIKLLFKRLGIPGFLKHEVSPVQGRVPKFAANNTTLPLLRAFMNGLSLMPSTVSGAQNLLSQCITALTWAGLEFRADKLHSITIVKGRSITQHLFLFQKHQTNQKFHFLFLLFTLDQSSFWVA